MTLMKPLRGIASWWFTAALLLCLLFSPPAAGLLMASLAVVGLFLHADLLHLHLTRSRWTWVGLGALALLIVALIWLAWGQITPEGMSNPLEVIRWWVRKWFRLASCGRSRSPAASVRRCSRSCRQSLNPACRVSM